MLCRVFVSMFALQLPPASDANDNSIATGKALLSPSGGSAAAAAQAAGPLSVLEVADPKVCILAHLMSPLEPIEPILESPLAHPLLKQRLIAGELLNEVQQANSATGAMLLANMERTGNHVPVKLWLGESVVIFISAHVFGAQPNSRSSRTTC